MKKLSLYIFLVLMLLIINNCSFDSKTYLKCEPYNDEGVHYFAFSKRYIYFEWDSVNLRFNKNSSATYGERYINSGNIKINREQATVTISPSLSSIFWDVLMQNYSHNTQTKTIVLNCEEISKTKLPKEKVDKKF